MAAIIRLGSLIVLGLGAISSPLIVAGVYGGDEEKKRKYKMDQLWGGAAMITGGIILSVAFREISWGMVGLGVILGWGGIAVMATSKKK